MNSLLTLVITIYGIPNCDTVKKSRAWFDAAGIAYQFHDFKKQGVTEETLREWVQVIGWEPLLNKKGTTWRKLDAATQAAVMDAESAISIMSTHSSIIKRPIATYGVQMTLGYAPEAWERLKLLGATGI